MRMTFDNLYKEMRHLRGNKSKVSNQNDNDNDNEKNKTVIQRHQDECHDGETVEFEMKVIKTHQNDPLARQSGEAIMIRELDPAKKINSKQEWCQPEDI